MTTALAMDRLTRFSYPGNDANLPAPPPASPLEMTSGKWPDAVTFPLQCRDRQGRADHSDACAFRGRITSGDDDSQSPVPDICAAAAEILPWTTGMGRLP